MLTSETHLTVSNCELLKLRAVENKSMLEEEVSFLTKMKEAYYKGQAITEKDSEEIETLFNKYRG